MCVKCRLGAWADWEDLRFVLMTSRSAGQTHCSTGDECLRRRAVAGAKGVNVQGDVIRRACVVRATVPR